MVATNTEKSSLATKYAADAVYAALFTADPGATGSVTGEVSGGSYARVAISWGAASNGVITGTASINVPVGTTITFAGVCSGSTGANLLDKVAITSQTYASAGTYVATFQYTQS
jgi:hypothetical protein